MSMYSNFILERKNVIDILLNFEMITTFVSTLFESNKNYKNESYVKETLKNILIEMFYTCFHANHDKIMYGLKTRLPSFYYPQVHLFGI